jgi:GT2 family glycosyltransferase
MSTRSSVAVIVPNRDGARLLPQCLDALLVQSRPADEVIVVDDASRDASCALLAREFPQVRVIALDHNVGFAGAVNAGIAAANSENVALLNNDAIPHRDWIAALLDAATRHPDYHAFACRMSKANADGSETTPPVIDSAGLALAHGFTQVSIGDGELDGPGFDGEREVLGACGGAALYRKSYLDALGGFDSRYFAYFEDYDLAVRGVLRGYRTLYVGGARVRHLGSATLGRHSARGTRLYARNSLRLLGAAVPLGLLLRESIAIEWSRLRMLALAATRGRFIACLLGLIAGKFHLASEVLRRGRKPLQTTPQGEAALEAWLDAGEALRRARKQLVSRSART